MDANLARIKVALAVMSNAELDALIQATYKVDQIAPGLLAWLDSACAAAQWLPLRAAAARGRDPARGGRREHRGGDRAAR